MPFKSQDQRAFMHIHHPRIAKRWEKHTPKGKLPKSVGEANHCPKMTEVFKVHEAGLPSGTKNVTLNQVKTDMKRNLDQAVKNIGNIAQKGDVQIKQTPPKPNDPKNLTGGYSVVDTAGNVSKLDPTTGQLQTDPTAGSQNTPFSSQSPDPGTMNR